MPSPTSSSPTWTDAVSVVIPAFNEVEGVERCLTETISVFRELGAPFEVLLVDDGSGDATAERALAIAAQQPEVRVISADRNSGKGEALLQGALRARNDLILFVDADLEIHPRQFTLLYDAMQASGADIVIGSKLHPDARVDVPAGLRVLSQGYYALVRTMFHLPVHDTQTGLKLYRRATLADAAPRILCKRFATDLELLVTSHRHGAKIVEVPVVVTRERAFPRIGRGDVRNIAQDTAAIWYRAYLRRWYDRPVTRWSELTPSSTDPAEREPVR